MKRTASNPASPPASVHINGSCSECAVTGAVYCSLPTCPGKLKTTRRPKRKWRPEVERDRSMRAYELNPRALREAIDARTRELLGDETERCLGLASESRYAARCRCEDCRAAAAAARRERRQNLRAEALGFMACQEFYGDA